MCPDNPWKAKRKKTLTQRLGLDTLEGGAGGHDESTPEASAAYSAANASSFAQALATCLDALLDMHRAADLGDRESLDNAYQDLITSLEVYRDGVPKA